MRYLLSMFLVLVGGAVTQAQLAVGDWVSYNAYSKVTLVEEAPDVVYAVGDGSLFAYGKDDNSITTFDKITGLSDSEITKIRYSWTTSQLVVIYSNSNIDFISAGSVYNLSDIKDKTLSGEKTVNHYYEDNGRLYLSTSFGLVILDLEKREIKESCVWNKNIVCSTVMDGYIYISTEDGLYRCQQSANFSDFSNWKLFSQKAPADMSVFKGRLMGLFLSDGLYYWQNDDWVQLHSNSNIVRLKTASNGILYSMEKYSAVFFYDNFTERYNRYFPLASNVYDVSMNNTSDVMWTATASELLSQCSIPNRTYQVVNSMIAPSGASSNYQFYMAVRNGKLYVAGGGKNTNRYNRTGQVSILDNGTWTNFSASAITKASGQSFKDVVHIAIDPENDNHLYAFTWGEGIYEFLDGEFVKLYNYTNSGVESIFTDNYNYHRVDGGVFDASGNLWFTNSEIDNSIKVMTSSGEWKSFAFESMKGHNNIEKIVIDSRGYKWINVYNSSNKGLFVWDDNESIDDTSDDTYKYFTSFTYLDSGADASLSASRFYCAVEDKDGAMWIGTDVGPIISYSPSKIFNDSHRFTRIKIPRNDGTDYADFLLGSEGIKCIAVDGGNRKWIGTTSNGVYLISADGLETIHHFTSDNSPLLSDAITSLAIDDASGLVYIGTANGLVAYQSDAIAGKEDFSQVYVYPNPVRPEYNGVITITGLMDNSLVKITDINNSLIYQANSLGGQMTWDGLNSKGDKVASGVYLVYGASEDGKKGVVSKILIIR